MKNDIEQQLDELRLREPSAELDSRMGELFSRGRVSNERDVIPFVEGASSGGGSVDVEGGGWSLMLRMLTAAAILVMGVLIYQTFNAVDDGPVITADNTPLHDHMESVGTETKVVETWSNVMPGEVITLTNGQSLQPVQYQTLERVETINPENNVRTESLVPRNEILLIPVSFD